MKRLSKVKVAKNGEEGASNRQMACFICKGPHIKGDCLKKANNRAMMVETSLDQGNKTGPGQQ